MAQYAVNQHSVKTLLSWIESDNIAIPEMQRPFVWSKTKVRDLMDSLYRGFPVGYLITWQSKAVPVKGGGNAGYQHILIDGQQRVTALRAAIAGEEVINKNYRTERVIIAFNPQTESFETATPVLRKQPEWIYDISEQVNKPASLAALRDYMSRNPEADEDKVYASLQKLNALVESQIGIISLNDDLDIETVAEIFVRINSKGVPLSAADFVMSKISANREQGRNLRKLIDYFAHLAVHPGAFKDLEQDSEFAATDYWRAISWLKNDTEDLYDPSYVDIIRVAAILAFRRGRMNSVVRELSGINPETREFEPERIPLAYDAFEKALLSFVRPYEFQKFIALLKSAGFVSPSMLTSTNAVNFSYALFLDMRAKGHTEAEINHTVRRWCVLLQLTGRATGSFESAFDRDLASIDKLGPVEALKRLEESELSEAFWKHQLPARLQSSSTINPHFKVFLAAQVNQRAHGFLSRQHDVQSLIQLQGDVHHLVPKGYLRKEGVNDKSQYNQIANFAMTESGINIRIGNRTPAEYLGEVREQIATGTATLGEIVTEAELAQTFAENAIPESLENTDVTNYEAFLEERRALMAEYIHRYYERL